MKTVTAYLSLGTNLGDRERNLAEAIARLERESVAVKRKSSLYETEPRDLLDQPWFLNMVVEIETLLDPLALLRAVLRVEADMGRERTVPKGPRLIDIDILLYGDSVVSTAELDIPHPELAQRRFVLEPLAELTPNLRHPQSGHTVREMLADVAGQIVRRLA